MSKRTEIVSAIAARMGNISTATGYNSNLGAGVSQWRTTPLHQNESLALSVEDFKNEDSEKGALGSIRWHLQVRMKILGRSTGVSGLKAVIEDIYKAVGVDPTWTQNAQRTFGLYDEIEFDQAGEITGRAYVFLTVEYDTPRWEM